MKRTEVDVVVVGVGGFGAAAVFHAANAGRSVVGVERFDVPHGNGSSTGETRVIRKAYFEDPRYVPLLHRAYTLWRDLERDVDDVLFERVGCLTFGPPAHAALEGVRASVTQHALPHEFLDDAGIAARFPLLRPTAGDVGVFEEDAGYLHVERCTTAHVTAAKKRGAVVKVGACVVALDVVAGGVNVDVDDGSVYVAQAVVVAGGAWNAHDPVLRKWLPDVPLSVERQVQHWFAAPKLSQLPCYIHFGERGGFYGIPGNNELKACRHHGGAVVDPDTVDRAVSAADVDDVRVFLRQHLPECDGPALRSKVCLYTNTPDENFVIGRSPLSDRVVVVGGCSGHGYKMASVIGEIAVELVHGSSRFDLGLFSPTRFH